MSIVGERNRSPQPEKARLCLLDDYPPGCRKGEVRRKKAEVCSLGQNLPQKAQERRQPLGQ